MTMMVIKLEDDCIIVAGHHQDVLSIAPPGAQ